MSGSFRRGGQPLSMQHIRRLFPALALLLLGLLMLAGCGSKKTLRPDDPGSTLPYTVRGKTYYPIKSTHGFVEEGIASWYGPSFHGKRTASGLRYNQNKMTAAHKLLPFGSKVRVTHLNNGKSVIVEITDRGPFSKKRVIDLSRAAAKKLDMIRSGTAPVRIQSLDTGGAPPATVPQRPAADESFYVQVGSFQRQAKAKLLCRMLAAAGHPGRILQSKNRRWWGVQVGPYSQHAARKKLHMLRRFYPDALIVGGM
jgi:rare lipoprotein A